jgi:hypothetical protein
MHKSEAIKLLGGTAAKARDAMGYQTIQAIYMWPDVLSPSIADRVIGASTRLKKPAKPKAKAKKARV